MTAPTKSAETWQEVLPGNRLTPGVYRMRGTFRGPYNAVTTHGARAFLSVAMTRKGLKMVGFSHAAPLVGAHDGGELAPWPFVARFEYPPTMEPSTAGLDGKAVLALLALVAAAGLALTVVIGKLDKLVGTVGDKLVRPPLDTLGKLLSPGTLVLAAFGLFIFLRARK